MAEAERVNGRIILEYSTVLGRVRGALKILLFGRATYDGPWLVHRPGASGPVIGEAGAGAEAGATNVP